MRTSATGGSHGYAVNSSNVIAGYCETASRVRQACRWTNNGATVSGLGGLGGTESVASAINDVGQIAGWAKNASAQVRAFRWQNGTMQDLGSLGGNVLEGTVGMNEAGQVIGGSQTTAGAWHAFLWSNGVMTDLNDLLSPGSGWVLEAATDINDSGQVVGSGCYNGQAMAYLFSVPPSQ